MATISNYHFVSRIFNKYEFNHNKPIAIIKYDKELQQLRANKAITSSKLSKAKSDYEAVLKKQSINDISARALLAFDELQEILYEKSIRAVEQEFQIRFNRLINKSDLIDGIHIDENLNVLPYRVKKFSAKEIKKSLLDNHNSDGKTQIRANTYFGESV